MRIKKKSKKVKRCNPIKMTKENGPKKMAMGGLEPPTSEL